MPVLKMEHQVHFDEDRRQSTLCAVNVLPDKPGYTWQELVQTMSMVHVQSGSHGNPAKTMSYQVAWACICVCIMPCCKVMPVPLIHDRVTVWAAYSVMKRNEHGMQYCIIGALHIQAVGRIIRRDTSQHRRHENSTGPTYPVHTVLRSPLHSICPCWLLMACPLRRQC